MKLCPKCHKQFSDDANFCPVDAARLAPLESQAVAADTLAAKFELGERLGGSRTGAVYRATDKATGQAAAVKIIAPAVIALPGLAQRIERELKQLERVHTAGVAKVLASGKRGDETWVALELIAHAQTLNQAIGARGALPADQAAALIEVVGEALIEAAQVGVVHRDLAPKNILLAGDGVKLINFSLPVPGHDRAAGVAEFVAPEQHDGKAVDQRSNLFSLGALYYFVLTGQTIQHDDAGAIKPPSALVPVAAAVDAAVLRALDRSPTKRFLTVRQFVDEVGRIARGDSEPRSMTAPLPTVAEATDRTARPKAELVQTLLGVGGELVPPAAGERSPWAAPVAVAAAPANAVPAPPVVPPELLAQPMRAPEAAEAQASGSDEQRGKFRETLWFKKGEMDVQAAEAAAEARARTGKDGGHDKSDMLPIDERYKDDGTLSRTDKDKYSLRTGGTLTHKAVRDGTGARVARGTDDALIGELKSGRNLIIAGIAVALVIAVLVIVLVVR